MGGCQNVGPFLCTLNIRCRIIIRDPERDHNFDNHPCLYSILLCLLLLLLLLLLPPTLPWIPLS